MKLCLQRSSREEICNQTAVVLNVDSMTIARVYEYLGCIGPAPVPSILLARIMSLSPQWPCMEEVLSFRVHAAQGYATGCRES